MLSTADLDRMLVEDRRQRARRDDRALVALGVVERKFNELQPRDPGGEGGGQWTKSPVGEAKAIAKDALRLAGKIDLAPDEQLVGSAKFDGDAGGIRLALTERGGHRMLRFGAGSEGYGQRNREEGIPAWDGNPSPEPLSAAERKRLSAELDALGEEYDNASPDREREIDDRRAAIRERLTTDDIGFNGTAELDEYASKRLVDRIRPALDEALDEAKAEAKAWDEIEALQAKGSPDPARMADLRRRARADATDTLIFTQGIVPGSAWGDVHFSVELDESEPYVKLGVMPKGAPDDWGADKDWQGRFDPAETRKILRLLDKFGQPT